MVIGFLLLTLVVGLYYSRKVKTFREYAVGNKQFATATLVATVLATRFGGGTLIRTVESVHSGGLYWIGIWLLACLNIWLISKLTLRMGPFMHHFSIAESIGSVYGKYPKVITAFASICSAIAALAGQITAMSMAIRMCINVANPQSIIILSSVILIIYSTFGGIRAVTFTDVLQLITFTLVIPLLAGSIFAKIDITSTEIISFLQAQQKFQFKNVYHYDLKLIGMLCLILSNLVANIQAVTIQRVYMSTNPIQANRVFLYASIFGTLIVGCIILIGLFVFIIAPELPQDKVWNYIMGTIPSFFKGFISISLLAMTMSTADSYLNTCSVMVSHDIIGTLENIRFPYVHRFRLARFITPIVKTFLQKKIAHPLLFIRLIALIVGLISMVVAWHCNDLLKLLLKVFDFSVPIITAPYILAIFGFRSSSYTALIGMIVGAFSILTWNKWVQPMVINGSFFCMLANGLAMLAAHYLLPQPAGTGWVPPDKTYQQVQQEKERMKRRNKRERAAFFTKENLTKLKPNAITVVLVGIYLVIVSLVSNYYYNGQAKDFWKCLPFCMLGAVYIGYVAFFTNKISDWVVGSCWFFSLLIALPLHLLLNCCLCKALLFPFLLFFIHGAVLLWALPLYWSLRGVLVTMGIIMVICCCKSTILWPASTELLPVLIAGLCLLIGIVYFKYQNRMQQERVTYFLQQNEYKASYELKKLAYSEELPTASSPQNALAQEGTILEKAIQNVTQSIAFVNSTTPFLKEDFQSILDKFAEWAYYFRSRAKRQDQLLLQPSIILLEALIDAGEVAYQKEKGYLPGLWVEEFVNMPATMLGDREQLVRLLFLAFSYVRQSSVSPRAPITLQLQSTQLRYKKREPLEEKESPDCITFPALALVVHTENKQIPLPTLQAVYDVESPATTQPVDPFVSQHKVNLRKKNLASIVHAHYGLLLLPHAEQLVCLLPLDVTQVREEMLGLSLPREAGTQEEASITPHEKTVSLAKLSAFHDWIPSFESIDPFLIAEILLLLRRCYGFKRHASGQLFYVRAVGIAEWVAAWTDGHAKLVYATLLYDLVRYTRLPLSYIKGNYNMGVYCFVENVIAIDSRERLEESLLAIANRLKESLQKEHISVLYVKLAERLYDLKHASGYKDPAVVQAMAKESLTIDVELAQRYGEPGMAILLKQAAEEALLINKQ
ncbi:hypothetical protein DK880_00513 [Candidatus Cardinium hertigii]|uniref:High-affinity proline transporter PutP n=2 Tax=Candidatus Cardinium hertigii TaxID=247481 RepID=A0A2Z3LHC1_9BACT|nr:hypothetical protein DK880_00513 [Candidatus Cardinium hertigii]